jgi:ferredoxin
VAGKPAILQGSFFFVAISGKKFTSPIGCFFILLIQRSAEGESLVNITTSDRCEAFFSFVALSQDIKECMKQVIIEKEKCTGCALCSEICPYRAIEILDGRAVYVLDDCFLCGHCQAVCPEEAVMVSGLETALGLATLEEKLDVVQPGISDGAELVALMRSRRSCRSYKDRVVCLVII